MAMTRNGWGKVMLATVVLAVVSMLTNINTPEQMSMQANGMRVVRLTFSYLTNAGVVWAGIMILAGWLVKYPRQAAAAGVAAGWLSLVIHYALGRMVGIYGVEIWEGNLEWFFLATVVGAPLGLVGSLAHRDDDLGLLARLMVPVGAIAEPLLLGKFVHPEWIPWPDRVASVIAGLLLILAGLTGLVLVLRRWRSARPEPARELSVMV